MPFFKQVVNQIVQSSVIFVLSGYCVFTVLSLQFESIHCFSGSLGILR
jgi:hypothetical protein